ncbi:MAG: DUF721 domain-containing protein [Alphaproteobacteria bacterium]|nr:DUF721 domain-containing protein [Alphaproteobacteria bacterium]
MKPARDWKEVLEEEAALARLSETRAIPAYRSAHPVSRALTRALAPLLKQAGPAPGTLAARWPEIVGERLAAVTEPVKVSPGRGGATLTIRAPSAAAPMIQHAADHIIQRVNLTGAASVKTLKIIQTSARTKPAAAAVSAPLGRAERADLERRLDGVEAPAIRKALAELGEAVLSGRSRT